MMPSPTCVRKDGLSVSAQHPVHKRTAECRLVRRGARNVHLGQADPKICKRPVLARLTLRGISCSV